MVELAARLSSHGLIVDLVTGDTPDQFPDRIREVANVIPLFGSQGELRNRFAKSLKHVLPLRRYLSNFNPDVLFVTWRTSEATLAWLGTKRRSRLVFNAQVALEPIWRRLSKPRRYLHRSVLRFAYGAADSVVSPSKGVAEEIQKIANLKDGKVKVLPNPVIRTLREVSGQVTLRRRGGEAVILGAGSLIKQKGFDVLLEAFNIIRKKREARLVIVGEGPDRDSLEEKARELGIEDDVEMPGYVQNIFEYFEAADLFVLSSNWEGFGLVVVEALSAGKPVVTTDCPYGPREILDDGHYGEIVPVGDSLGMAEAIDRTLANPPSRQLLQNRAEEFDAEKVVEKYARLFSGENAVCE